MSFEDVVERVDASMVEWHFWAPETNGDFTACGKRTKQLPSDEYRVEDGTRVSSPELMDMLIKAPRTAICAECRRVRGIG